MKKRFFGVALAVSMMLSAIPGTVSAYMERDWEGNENLVLDGWTTSFVDVDPSIWTNETKAESYGGITTSEGYESNAALYFKKSANQSGSAFIRAKITLNKPLLQSAESYPEADGSNPKKYRISFRKKGYGSIFTYYDNYKETNTWYHVDPNPGTTSGADDDNWYYYWRDIEVSGEESYENLYLRYATAGGEILIDDVSIRQYTSATTLGEEEYVPNGGFENYVDWTYPSDSEAYYGGWSYPSYASATLWTKELRDKTYAAITTADKKSGTTSLMVKSYGAPEGAYIRYINTLAEEMPSGKTYRISFWLKGAAKSNVFTYINSWLHNGNGYEEGETVDGWKYYYKDVTTAEVGKTLTVYTNASGVKYMIDDISIREVVDGVVQDKEYVVNGGFEGQFTINPTDKNKTSNWTETYSNITDRANQYMAVTAADARTGNYSLYSHFENDNASNVYIANRQYVDVTAGTTYVIEAWIKGNLYKNDVLAFRDIDNGFYKEIKPLAKETVDGWTRYETEFTASSTGKAFIGILSQGVQQCYIDDLALYAKNDSAKTNLFVNGGFENTKAIETKRLINPIAYAVQSGSAVNLTWTNPTNENISAIKILVDGEEQTELSVNTASEAFNSVLIDGLTNGQDYQFDVVSTVDGTDYTDTMYAAPYNMGAYTWLQKYIGNRPSSTWNVHKRDNGSNYANFNASLDTAEKNSGDYSFKMSANLPEIKANVYPGIAQTVEGLERGKLYGLKFRYKSDGVKVIGIDNRALLNGATSEKTVKNSIVPTDGEWQTCTLDIMDYENVYSYDSTETYRTDIYIYSDHMVGTLWIDDVELYEVDSDGYPVDGKNLLKDGGFEYKGTYEISTPTYVIEADGEEIPIKNLQGGKINVTAKIRNFAAGDDMDACVIVAFYDGNKLLSAEFMEKQLDEIPYYLPAEEYTATVTVPNEYRNCKIKVMYWDTMGKMNSIDVPAELVYTPES